MPDVQRIVIRNAEPDDAAMLAELGARTFRDAFATQNTEADMADYIADSFSTEIQQRELTNPRWRTLIADSEGLPVGYAQICYNDEAPDCVADRNACIELRRIYVDRNWYGHRIGARLLDAAKAAARAIGAETMWLGVWQHNDAAQRFYKHHSFSKVGEKIFQVGSDPQQDDVLLCEL